VEKEIKELSEAINVKLDGNEATIKAQGEKIEALEKSGVSIEDTKKELLAANAELTKNATELMDLVKKQGEATDAMEIKLKKGVSGQPQSMRVKTMEMLEAKAEDIANVASTGKGAVNMSVKAGDMTIANTYTNDVAALQTLPGVYFNPDRSVHIRDFMNVLPTGAVNSIRYMQETAFDDGVAAKVEGSAAGQSDFDLTEQSAVVKNIATYVTVSKEMLEDTPFLNGYINTRLFSKLLKEEDDQILHGTGSGANISGISVNASAYIDLLADSKVNRFDVLLNALTNAYNAEYTPNVIFIHPTDWLQLVTSKDDNGMPIYPQQVLAGGMVTVNGVPVVPSTAVTSDEFFVGDFRGGATLGMREDVNISISDQHSTNFIDGNVTVMAEERIALPIHNASAFIYGDFSNALALGSA